MTLLVAGADRVDAGKTTFTAGLLARTGAVGFKPRAGNDYWFDHDDVTRAVSRGRLFGKDARTIAEASPGALEPEDLNPVHRLWNPSPGPGTGLLGQTDREFVVDRAGSRYVVNETVEIPESVRNALPLDSALRVETLEELNDATERHHLPALSALADDIDATDRAVVESYSDVARPLRTLDPDAVAVVEPLRARFYDGDRYVRGCEVASRSPTEGTLEKRVGDVADLLDPVGRARLPPLEQDQKADPEAVADAYGDAYDRLLAVAEERTSPEA